MPQPVYVVCGGVAAIVAAGLCAWFVGVGRFDPMDVVAPAKRDSPATIGAASGSSDARMRQVPARPPEILPKFDVVRIDPQGASVFAGNAGPNQVVTVLINGQEFAQTVADSDGQWAVVIERPIPTGRVEIALIARDSEHGQANRGQVVHMTVTAPRVASRLPDAGAQKAEHPLLIRPEVDAKQALRRFEKIVDHARATVSQASAAPSVQAPIPIPITFLTDKAVMTSDGTKAAELLVDYLRIMKPRAVALTGHADSRGPEGYNLELSRRRLTAIEQFLRAAGYEGELKLMPLGETMPYNLVDRSKLTAEERYQLDRRVELQVTGRHD